MSKLLYAHILLDRSGSMEVIRDKTIDAFNEYVHSLTSDSDLDAAVSLTLFDCHPTSVGDIQLETVFDGIKAKVMPPLTRETYTPRGTTPLNDAIGRTVARMDNEWHRPGELIALVILTDGMENASHEYNTAAVKALLDDRRDKKNWLILYLGANQDAFAEGGARGIVTSHTINFDAQHIHASMGAAARATKSYAATGQSMHESVGFTSEERKAAEKDEKKMGGTITLEKDLKVKKQT